MNKFYIITLLFISKFSFSYSQAKIEFAVSSFKRINTTPFFNAAPVASNKPLAAVPNKVEDDKGLTTLYFDKNNKKTSAEKAYYYRKVRFNQSQVAIGNVEDYYKSANKLKFIGAYYIYKPDDETANNLFQGECVFYEEDGTKAIRKYNNGQLLDEKIYLPNGKLKIENLFNPNKTKRYFKEVVSYYANGVEKELFIGRYDEKLKVELSKKYFYNEKGEEIMVVDYESACPKATAVYYKHDRTAYSVIQQGFSCPVNTKEWSWRGNQYFTTSYLDKESKYQILSTDVGIGFLTIPLTTDLKTKPFEFIAEFEKAKKDNVKEFGVVWQYQNDLNYSYFLINTEKRTFEVNTKQNGETGKIMIGIRPQINLSDGFEKYILKVSADPVNNKYVYSVNDQVIQGFNKFPLIPNTEIKNFNFGYIYKSSKANEYLNLKKLECKLY